MAVKKYAGVADLIFVDAPYDAADLGASFVRAVTRRARAGTFLIWEQESANFTQPPHAWDILRDKTYGRATNKNLDFSKILVNNMRRATPLEVAHTTKRLYKKDKKWQLN